MELENTTVYTREQVLRFQRFDARIFKAIPAGSHIIFALLFILLACALAYSINAHRWLFTALFAIAIALLGRRYYFLYIAPARKFDDSSFKDLKHKCSFRDSGANLMRTAANRSFIMISCSARTKRQTKRRRLSWTSPASLKGTRRSWQGCSSKSLAAGTILP